eukprot:g75142.t1
MAESVAWLFVAGMSIAAAQAPCAGVCGNNVACKNSTCEPDTVYSNVNGGSMNKIQAQFSTIGGGLSNFVAADTSVIAGGENNTISLLGGGKVIGGGSNNTIGPTAWYGVIPGGYNNRVEGPYGFAAGVGAISLNGQAVLNFPAGIELNGGPITVNGNAFNKTAIDALIVAIVLGSISLAIIVFLLYWVWALQREMDKFKTVAGAELRDLQGHIRDMKQLLNRKTVQEERKKQESRLVFTSPMEESPKPGDFDSQNEAAGGPFGPGSTPSSTSYQVTDYQNKPFD